MSWVAVPEEHKGVARLLVHVEGQTEETFVNEVLAPHLRNHGYARVSARLVGNARHRDHRGGISAWSAVRNDILRHIKEDAECLVTTMIDYYGLPATGARAWPGREAAGRLPFLRKAAALEEALLADIRDSALTAPSKRVEALVPGYEKPFFGILAVLEIGLDRIRRECPHFREWLERLENGLN